MEAHPKVIIRCLVYNHEPYLRDCLEGFVMQQTNFPFKAVVHDDASTDNSAAIIREYAEKYPHIIEPIYETENQYSKHDGSLGRIMNAATLGRSPYLAYCEGDDYWIDPLKLQKQVDYMDAHPECSMTCTNAEILTPEGVLEDATLQKRGWIRPQKTGILKTEDIINKGGENIYIHTCTMVVRPSVIPELRRTIKNCTVGDYPLQIMATLRGRVYYFHEKTACYRYGHPESWTGKFLNNSNNVNWITKEKNSILHMLADMNKYSGGMYNAAFVSTQIRTVTQYLSKHPKYRKEILKNIGWVLRYTYLSKHIQIHHRNFISWLIFTLKRILIWPYYPIDNALKLLLPKWHPAVLIGKLLNK